MIDRQKQYFVAESTKTLDLVNNNKSEEENDGLWFGCGTVDKSGRLCEKTIELPPSVACSPSLFTVTDLSKDKRFNQLPFVTGPPHFRYYAGTPLTTEKGVNIGSLFILDDVVRPCLSNDQERFLATIARTVMKHMEITMEADEGKKVMRFSRGMNAFVEGKSRVIKNDDLTQRLGMVTKDRSKSEEGPTKKRTDSGSKSHISNNGLHSDQDSSQEDSDFGNTNKVVDTDHRTTFARAASILCESLDVRERGGVVFFDATSRHRKDNNDSHERTPQKPADIVSYATAESELGLGNQSSEVKSFKAVDETMLHSLLARYARGKLWSFDQDGSLSSSEEEALSPRVRTKSEGRQIGANRKQVEGMMLQKHFPGVRQLIFSGLWDASSSRFFAGGFAWTTSSRQIFSREIELNFFMAFGNSVMAEVSRLASVTADRQKADFIGSISHEFRSPLVSNCYLYSDDLLKAASMAYLLAQSSWPKPKWIHFKVASSTQSHLADALCWTLSTTSSITARLMHSKEIGAMCASQDQGYEAR